MKSTLSITPYGAAEEVTGSNMVLTHQLGKDEVRVMIDCGLFQGNFIEAFKKNSALFPYDPRRIEAVAVTHAHIDHCGRIPQLVACGFRGAIFATLASADIFPIMWKDTIRIQEEEARRARARLQKDRINGNRKNNNHETDDDFNPRGRRDRPRKEFKKKPAIVSSLPTTDIIKVTEEHMVQAMSMVHEKTYNQWFRITKNIRGKFIDTAHVLGSAGILIECDMGDHPHRLFFTGDIGSGRSFLGEPQLPGEQNINTLVMESTYGNRERKDAEKQIRMMKQKVRETLRRGGKVIVPAFALERTQEFMMELDDILKEINQELKTVIPVYMDSPMALQINNVFRDHILSRAQEENAFKDYNPFGADKFLKTFIYEGLKECYFTMEQRSQHIRELHSRVEPCVIISSSGMCEYGPIRDHIQYGIQDPNNLVLIIGYMAQNTLGRRLFELHHHRGAGMLRINGHEVAARAKILAMDVFSSHADQTGLYRYARNIPYKNRGEATIILNHGEPDATDALQEKLIEKMPGLDPAHIFIPSCGEIIRLE